MSYWGNNTDPNKVRDEGDEAYRFNASIQCPYTGKLAEEWHLGWSAAKDRLDALDRRYHGPIGELIDESDASEDVKHILRRIAEHVGMDLYA